MRTFFRFCILGALYALPPAAVADYVATGDIQGNVCKGFILESCRMVTIDAAEGDDGRLYTITKRYSKVSEFDEDQGQCWIYTKSKGWGFLSAAANVALQPVFFVLNEDGEYEEVDVEYLTFKCVVQ